MSFEFFKEMDGFKHKIMNAADFLRSLCSTGEPTEEQVKEATQRFGLPITFDDQSFVIDPVRMAVFTTAYIPRRAAGAIENAWSWHRAHSAA